MIENNATKQSAWIGWIGVIGLVYLLLLGVGIVGDGFKWISGGTEGAEQIFAFATNPIVGVILGVLATSLVQSSSTVSAVIVGLVAGGVPVAIAIPMIMGANMGTTITNTIVSMGSIRDKSSFKRSFQAATVHDFFNFFSIIIFLPLEMLFHPLENIASYMSNWFVGSSDASVKDFNFIGAITKPITEEIVTLFKMLPDTTGAILTIVFGIALIIGSVLYLGKLLKKMMVGRAKEVVVNAVGRGPLAGVASGTVVTVLVQSSSTTTSLVVPLAGAGVLSLRQIFPFTMGANIGTTITALLAATSISGGNEVFALQIALVHLLYNVFGVLLFLYTPWLKDLPIICAEKLGEKTEENRGWAFGYLFSVFFIVPGAVLAGQAITNNTDPAIIEAEADKTTLHKIEKELLEKNVNFE